MQQKLNNVWALLKYTYGIVPILAGLDKFFNILAYWPDYLSPVVSNYIDAPTFMMIVGVVEIIAGIIVLSKWTKWGAYLVSLWLVLIAINLLTLGMFYDIAVRDLVLAIGAFSLAQLTDVKNMMTARKTA